MEISYKGHAKGIVTAAWMRGRPVLGIYMNGEKLYPIDTGVATQLLVDIALSDIDGPLNYWMHALYHNAQQKEIISYEDIAFCPYSDYHKSHNWWAPDMRRKGYTVSENEMTAYKNPVYGQPKLFSLIIDGKTYKEGEDFTFDVNTGFINFIGKQMPEVVALTPGTKIKLQATVGQYDTPWLSVTQQNGEASAVYDLPFIDDTKFFSRFYKGEKKVNAGSKMQVIGLPSNTEIFWGWAEEHGKGRWESIHWIPWEQYWDHQLGGPGQFPYEKPRYNMVWTPGDTQIKFWIQGWNNTEPTAFIRFPEFTKEWSLTVLGVLIKQI